MNNNDYREITEDDVTTVSTDQKEEMNGQESVNDTPDVSENEKETVQAEVTNSDVSDEKEPEYEDICYICRRPYCRKNDKDPEQHLYLSGLYAENV
mgnify:CR=1 FL=1